MNEFDARNVEKFVEQDVSDEEIAKKAGEFINKGRAILFSWPEFQDAIAQKFLHREIREDLSAKFHKGGLWFTVYACETDLEISWADDEVALEEGGWKEEGGRVERVRSRTISIAYYEKLPRSNKSHGSLFYEGPEIKVPTRTFTMPGNTRAVIEQIEKGFAELGKL